MRRAYQSVSRLAIRDDQRDFCVQFALLSRVEDRLQVAAVARDEDDQACRHELSSCDRDHRLARRDFPDERRFRQNSVRLLDLLARHDNQHPQPHVENAE